MCNKGGQYIKLSEKKQTDIVSFWESSSTGLDLFLNVRANPFKLSSVVLQDFVICHLLHRPYSFQRGAE